MSSTSSASLSPPHQLNSWTLGKKIGSGEFGAVYEVTRKDCEGEWVAKITHVGDGESSSFSATGAKRAKLTKDRAGTSSTGGKALCARLLFWEYQMYQSYARNDPVFPRLPPRDSYGTASGWKYLVMERIPGVNLKQLVEARRRGSEKDDDDDGEEEEDNNDVTAAAEYCKIGREILRGMRLIHDKGLLFRDVKPDNIIYDEASGRVALIDFGAAARFLTATGVQNMTPLPPAGTPIFMSIWTSESQPPSPREDLDSLGYLMVYLLSSALDAPRPSVASKRGNGTSSSSSSSFELPWSRLGSLPLVVEAKKKWDYKRSLKDLAPGLIAYFDSVRAMTIESCRGNKGVDYGQLDRILKDMEEEFTARSGNNDGGKKSPKRGKKSSPSTTTTTTTTRKSTHKSGGGSSNPRSKVVEASSKRAREDDEEEAAQTQRTVATRSSSSRAAAAARIVSSGVLIGVAGVALSQLVANGRG